MKKLFYCFVVGMMFLSSLVVSGVTVDNNDTPVTEKENIVPYVPCMGVYKIYNWDPVRYDIEVDDTHESIYNDTEGWETSEGYKNVTIEWEINKEEGLVIDRSFSLTLFWKVREWLSPPFSILRFFMRYTGNLRVESYRIIGQKTVKPKEWWPLYPISISWGPGDTFPKKGTVEIKLHFTKKDISDMNIVAFLWAGRGSFFNYDFAVIHAHFNTPTPP